MNSTDAQSLRSNARALLDQAERGQSTVITRFGKPVAVLAPYQMDPPTAASPERRHTNEPMTFTGGTSTNWSEQSTVVSDENINSNVLTIK